MTPETRAAFERMEPKAIKKLEDLIDSPDEQIALKAATLVIERRYGKAAQPVTGGDGEGPIALQLVEVAFVGESDK